MLVTPPTPSSWSSTSDHAMTPTESAASSPALKPTSAIPCDIPWEERIRRRTLRMAHGELRLQVLCGSPRSCLIKALQIYDPGLPVTPEIVDGLEKIYGLQHIDWPSAAVRASLLTEKVWNGLEFALCKIGYRVFSNYGHNGRGYMRISPEEGQDPPPLPEGLRLPYLVPVKGYSLRYHPESCKNPIIETGAPLCDVDLLNPDNGKEIGTLGPIMSSSRPGKPGLIHVALTAGHVIPDGVDSVMTRNLADSDGDVQINLEVSPTSKRMNGKRVGYDGKSPAFTDDTAFLIIKPDDLLRFQHCYFNINLHYFQTTVVPVSHILDPVAQQRWTPLAMKIHLSAIVVFKKGSQSDLTMGHLVGVTREPPRGWYQSQTESIGFQSLRHPTLTGNSDGSDSEGPYDQDNSEPYGWFGVVKWSDVRFATAGDSGSLVFAFESGTFVPLGIHIGSPESAPGHSYFLSLETFCYEGEKEG
ncbi:hypothetical protein MW887_010925 [Aspergillus wentii]|nr:hypothetical protein MW887_010925 [Aspergillus wentii]